MSGLTPHFVEAGQFSIVNPVPVTGLTLGRNATYDLQVAFSTTTNGTKVRDLGFQVLGSGATSPTVNLTGTATDEPPTNQPGAQECTIVGTKKGETLTGTPGQDIICGLGGGDKINGLRANEGLRDGNRDILKGGKRSDQCAKDKRDRTRSC